MIEVPKDTRIVVTLSGERFAYSAKTEQGVEFDEGVIPWDDVVAFMSYNRAAQRWMSVPVN